MVFTLGIERMDEKTPMFSIIIPYFNKEDTIETAILNATAQTEGDFELILVDDGSTDASVRIIEEAAKKDTRIRLICMEQNCGPGPARDAGLYAARGEYVLFFDADDRVEPTLLSLVKKERDEFLPDVFVWSLTEEYGRYHFTHTRPSVRLSDVTLIHREAAMLEKETMLGYVWNKAYKRRVLVDNDIHFRDIRHIEDILFNIDVFYHINRLAVTSLSLYHYDNGGVTGVTGAYVPDYFALQKQRIEAFLKQQEHFLGETETALDAAGALYFRSFISFLERESAAGASRQAIVEAAKRELGTPLFIRLKDYAGDGRMASFLYAPLVKGQVEIAFLRARKIGFVKRTFPGLFARLKQAR